MTMFSSKAFCVALFAAGVALGMSGCDTIAPSAAPSMPAPLPATKNIGYTNTPLIPGTTWHVHDGLRRQPRVVTPGARFSHLAPPPSDAVVLFDGSDLSKWTANDGDARWKVEHGY